MRVETLALIRLHIHKKADLPETKINWTGSVSNFVPIDVQLVFGAHAILYGCLVWLNFGEIILFLVNPYY